MPNWCNNTLKIRGDEKQIARLAKKIKPKTFLSSFIPLPKELEGTTSPSKKKNLNLILKYKYDNWYDWQTNNWGTKWDIELETDEQNEYELIYSFDSAWTPPIKGIEKISAMFPKLTFWLEYEEEGCGFKGLARIQAGTTDNKCFDY